jgi:hypothetical protein
LIWIKRLAPLLAIVIVVVGYHLWTSYRDKTVAAEESRMAAITAQVWVKTARFAGQPERFVTWRDSMMAAEGVSRDELQDFLGRWTDHQEEYLSFAQRVQKCVDSLARIEDSVMAAEERAAADTGK